MLWLRANGVILRLETLNRLDTTMRSSTSMYKGEIGSVRTEGSFVSSVFLQESTKTSFVGGYGVGKREPSRMNRRRRSTGWEILYLLKFLSLFLRVSARKFRRGSFCIRQTSIRPMLKCGMAFGSQPLFERF